jgi:Protein of unknown function (DUF3592)
MLRPSRVTIIFLTVGSALLLGAGIAGNDWLQFRKKSVPVPGVVAEVYPYEYSGPDGRNVTSYGTIIGFTATDGKPHFFNANIYSGSPRFAKLESVRVRYDPQNPEKARLDEFWDNCMGTGILGLLGVVFLAAGGATGWWDVRAEV